MKKFIYWLPLIVLLIGLVACAPTLENYKAKSPTQQEAIATLVTYEKCYNSKNVKCFMGTFHRDARIMSRGRRIYTKQEYSKIIPGRMKEVVKILLGAPTSIRSEGDQVVITVPFTAVLRGGRRFNLSMTFYLVKEGQRYLIIRTKY